jgi:hypothetical protein
VERSIEKMHTRGGRKVERARTDVHMMMKKVKLRGEANIRKTTEKFSSPVRFQFPGASLSASIVVLKIGNGAEMVFSTVPSPALSLRISYSLFLKSNRLYFVQNTVYHHHTESCPGSSRCPAFRSLSEKCVMITSPLAWHDYAFERNLLGIIPRLPMLVHRLAIAAAVVAKLFESVESAYFPISGEDG